MFGFFVSRCQICGNIFKRRKYKWKLHRKTAWVCPTCNSKLEKKASSAAFGQDVDFPDVQSNSSGCRKLLFWFLIAPAIAGAVIFPFMPKDGEDDGTSASPSSQKLESPEKADSEDTKRATNDADGTLITHKILNREELGSTKLSLDVEVPLIDNRLPSSVELSALSGALVSDEKEHDRTFIVFYLPGMERGAGGFATGHHDPEPKVEIRESALLQYPQYHRFLPPELTAATESSPLAIPTETRVWHSQDGRELHGRVVEINQEAGTATIIRDDGQVFPDFKISSLKAEDQALLLGKPLSGK